MNLAAIKAVLEHLSGKCQDDMADKVDRPEDKLAEALEEASGNDDGDAEGDEPIVGHPELAAAMEEEDPDKVSLRNFMKPKRPGPTKPGTAVMIALESKKPPMGSKKGLKDMMHG